MRFKLSHQRPTSLKFTPSSVRSLIMALTIICEFQVPSIYVHHHIRHIWSYVLIMTNRFTTLDMSCRKDIDPVIASDSEHSSTHHGPLIQLILFTSPKSDLNVA
jgi:hypothetical protein